MDSNILNIEEIVMGGGEAAAPAELPSEKTEDAYTASIQEHAPPPVIQSYQHESLQCFQCFITFCNSKAKERHMKKSHREEYKQQLQQCDTLFTCYVCDRTFPSSEELTQHQSTHNKEDKPFKCTHCQECFRTFSELTTHRRQVCPERQFVCKECNETFRSPGLLRNHRLAQHPVPMDGEDAEDSTKTYRCGKCGRGFEEEAELLQHQENHAGDRHCNGSAAIKRRGRPPKTEASAAGEKKAKQKKEEEAEEPEETNYSEDASAKPATAEGKTGGRRGRPVKSTQEPKAEDDKAEKDDKKPVPQPALQIPCTECDLTFPSLAQLRAHKKEKHTQRKPHACGECEESFNRPEQLEAHMARAHSAGRHTCPTCGKSFGRESNLKAHQQSHGKEEKPVGKR
ncbi:zinc finger protein 510-like [Sinocyclocheilus grahami]|uniref:Zinc finger protein 510-like n=1 Tax=Sinocyclocheilus grahami TaxID=75366 RepID=A0A672S956_SINGR|nr:PREDICTED: zinc finger protein 510-like [Sinocyclocheilus grahami]XP_016138925.1 PREDICTED: zinc finger protein 510-like [Sinocyclocheilus grahami]